MTTSRISIIMRLAVFPINFVKKPISPHVALRPVPCVGNPTDILSHRIVLNWLIILASAYLALYAIMYAKGKMQAIYPGICVPVPISRRSQKKL